MLDHTHISIAISTFVHVSTQIKNRSRIGTIPVNNWADIVVSSVSYQNRLNLVIIRLRCRITFRAISNNHRILFISHVTLVYEIVFPSHPTEKKLIYFHAIGFVSVSTLWRNSTEWNARQTHHFIWSIKCYFLCYFCFVPPRNLLWNVIIMGYSVYLLASMYSTMATIQLE